MVGVLANQIGRVDEWVAVLSLLSAVASVVMSWQASRHGLLGLRSVHAAVSVMSLVYVAGYCWLLFGNPTSAQWSSVMRGFSLTAWIVVWLAPAWVSLRIARELQRALKDRGEL